MTQDMVGDWQGQVTSCAWGLQGLRLGWVASKDQQLLQQVKGLQHNTRSGPCKVQGLLLLDYDSGMVCDWPRWNPTKSPC